MRESLICIGKIGEKGYYFEDTGIQIFSYEELCYYMSQHMICYIHTLPGEDLLAYIRDELDLDKLSKQLSKLLDPEKDQMKYFAALFREGHYFNEDEIRDILDEYRGLMNAPVYLQKKVDGRSAYEFRTGIKGDTVLSGNIRGKRDKGRRSRTALS